MNTFTKLVIASVAAISTQAMADTQSNPFAAIEPAAYSQEANLSGSSTISHDVIVLKVVEPAVNSKEALLTDSNNIDYDFEEVAFHDVEPVSASKEAIL